MGPNPRGLVQYSCGLRDAKLLSKVLELLNHLQEIGQKVRPLQNSSLLSHRQRLHDKLTASNIKAHTGKFSAAQRIAFLMNLITRTEI